ncbi:MAG: hypothetical protein WBC44_14580 [Planctomycetaceae bacterium]
MTVLSAEIADLLRAAFGRGGLDVGDDRRLHARAPLTITLQPPLRVSQRRLGVTCTGTIGTIRVHPDRIEADVSTFLGRRTETIAL